MAQALPIGVNIEAMQVGRVLPRSFFERPCPEVARELLGTLLVRSLAGGERLVGRIVEVEAYVGDGSDPAAHSHRGPTSRNAVMFGPPGRLYTYFVYGMHTCANVVCGPEGAGDAVLFRALEPLEGLETMFRLRGLTPDSSPRAVASGPGRLSQAMSLRLEDNGAPLQRGAVTLRRASAAQSLGVDEIVEGPRVGISSALELPYRFHLKDCDWVSPWRAGRKSRA